MAEGRDTHNFRITKATRDFILARCSNPEALRSVFELLWPLALRRISVLDFTAHCSTLPCILWTPTDPDERHVKVQIPAESHDTVMIHVCRVVWAITHVVADQGAPLRGHEELLHSCGRNGDPNTGRNACLNPGHLMRGTKENRRILMLARRAMRQSGVKQIAV